jgi:choline-glycine betaine transporter
MPYWVLWPVAIGIFNLPLAIYALITRSAGIYQTNRQFWTVILVSAGISYLLTGALVLLQTASLVPFIIVSAIVPFLVGNVFSKGDVYGGDSLPLEEPEDVAEEIEEDEEATEETALLPEEPAARYVRFSDLLN